MSNTDKRLILLFHFEKGVQLEAVCGALFLTQIPVRNVSKNAYDMTIMQLAEGEMPSHNGALNEELDGQMMVFVNLSQEELHSVLSLLRSNPACGEIPYKAVMTDHNRNWNAYELLAELKKEHAAMHAAYKRNA